jgi:polyisoprenoid-binding protein YceI
MNCKINKKTMETILVFKVSDYICIRNLTYHNHECIPPITATKWTIDSNQSDVLIKARHSIIAYIAGSLNKFNGHLDIHEDVEDASVEFQLDVKNKETSIDH